MAVGDPEDSGMVYLFGLDNNDLSRAPTLGQVVEETSSSPPEFDLGFSDRFGFSVDLNAAGDRLAVGAIGDEGRDNLAGSGAGAVYLFDLNPSDLSEEAQFRAVIQDGSATLLGPAVEIESGDAFGFSVALTDDGRYRDCWLARL